MKRLALLGIVGLLAGLVWGGVALATGSGCDTTVDAAVDPPGSIQAAVDGASPGDHICLKGTFAGEPTVTIATSGITIRPGSTAVLDGGTGPAFSFAGGVHHVTIRDLEIRNRSGDAGEPPSRSVGVIEASEGPTSHITIRNNYIHHNDFTGIRASSEGDFNHNNWGVGRNTVVSNGPIGIRLANTSQSKIADNFVRNHDLWGIAVSANNLLGDHVSPVVSDVAVVNNEVGSTVDLAGIHVSAVEAQAAAPFSSINGVARVTRVTVKDNHVQNAARGIVLQAWNPGATVDHIDVDGNTARSSLSDGLQMNAQNGPSGSGTVTNILIERNVLADNGGSGIAATSGATSNVTIRNNYVHDNDNNGIVASSAGDFLHDNWRVLENIVDGNGIRGISLLNTTNSEVASNVVSDHPFTGIQLGAINTLGAHVAPVVTHVKVLRNDVSGSVGSAAITIFAAEGQGSPFLPIGGSARLTQVIVQDNRVHHNDLLGIAVLISNPGASLDHNIIAENTLVANGDEGIFLRGFGSSLIPGSLTENLVKGNESTGNGGDGYRADTVDGRNLFRNNQSNANGGFGYNNVSGPNVHQNNQCQFNGAGGSSPAGLCMPQ